MGDGYCAMAQKYLTKKNDLKSHMSTEESTDTETYVHGHLKRDGECPWIENIRTIRLDASEAKGPHLARGLQGLLVNESGN